MKSPRFRMRPRIDLTTDLATVRRSGTGALDGTAVAYRRQGAIAHDPVLGVERRWPQPLVLRAHPGVVVGVIDEPAGAPPGGARRRPAGQPGRTPRRSPQASTHMPRPARRMTAGARHGQLRDQRGTCGVDLRCRADVRAVRRPSRQSGSCAAPATRSIRRAGRRRR